MSVVNPIIKTLSTALISVLSLSIAHASGVGTTAGNILNIPLGARAVAMGEAYTAQADDVSSLYWNPAGLAILNQSQAAFSYNQWLQNTNLSQASVATPLENGGIGASVSYLSFGSIQGYDIHDNTTGNVNAYSGVATVGGAWLGDFWSAGANLKGVRADLAGVNANGFAADLGTTLIYPKEVLGGTLRLGATLRNLGTGLKFLNESDPFPTEGRVGIAAARLLDDRLNLSMDYGKTRDNKGAVYTGAEFMVGSSLALRAGYAGTDSQSNGLRLGVGFHIKDLSFDYAYSPYSDLGMTNRYELSLKFGAVQPLLSPEERKILRRGKQALREGRNGDAALLFNSLIDLEPRYVPVRRLMKLAMKGTESDERMAANANRFNFVANAAKAKPDNDPGEQAELEQLLKLDDTDAQQAKAAPKGNNR